MLAVASITTAQRQTRMTADMPKYDPATEETIQGIVVSVTSETQWAERTRSRHRTFRGTRAARLERVRMAGTHVLLDTPDGDIEVHVAPASFLASNGFEIARHEVIDVVGSRITVHGEAMIVARDITRDPRGVWTQLRDPDEPTRVTAPPVVRVARIDVLAESAPASRTPGVSCRHGAMHTRAL